MLAQIQNHEFLGPWHEDVMRRSKAAPTPKPQGQASGSNGSSNGSGNGDGKGGGVKPKIAVDDASFDPLTYKDKFGVLNVNPNLKKDLDLNTARTPCTRCGRIHRWGPELCTTNTDKENQTIEPVMSAAENLLRATKKWDLGFHFKSDPRERPKTVRPSPSAGASAAQATDTRIALTSGRGGGVTGRA
jgi:hypothetical protein